ncbi:hypothetical protein DEI86_12285 [Curtobacterium sp. MCBD17_028]|nr:hypothetical protein DEI86_12285 [Curtobacterium sp. MCBD17_028]
MARHWQRKGYTARVTMDREEGVAGTIYDGTVRKADAPELSYTAGDRRVLLCIDSQCADGDPHNFRRCLNAERATGVAGAPGVCVPSGCPLMT